MIVPSFNERRVGVQLREAVRFRHEPVQNWCQVNDGECNRMPLLWAVLSSDETMIV